MKKIVYLTLTNSLKFKLVYKDIYTDKKDYIQHSHHEQKCNM